MKYCVGQNGRAYIIVWEPSLKKLLDLVSMMFCVMQFIVFNNSLCRLSIYIAGYVFIDLGYHVNNIE